MTTWQLFNSLANGTPIKVQSSQLTSIKVGIVVGLRRESGIAGKCNHWLVFLNNQPGCVYVKTID